MKRPRQYTRATMLPIETPRAEHLGRYTADMSIDSARREALIELLCGIAAIEDHMLRQEVALQAMLAVYNMGNEVSEHLAQVVNRINREREEGGG